MQIIWHNVDVNSLQKTSPELVFYVLSVAIIVGCMEAAVSLDPGSYIKLTVPS